MRFAEFEELTTARLHLRKITMEDAAQYFARLGSSEEVTRYMLFRPHQDISESEAGIQKALRRYETGESYRWAIDLKGEGLIGVIDLLGFNAEKSRCSFAYMLGKDFWGRGYGTEALAAVVEFAFTRMEMEIIEADHFSENTGSGAVMRKVGMTYQGTVAGKYEKDGVIYDAPQYAITRQQWIDKT